MGGHEGWYLGCSYTSRFLWENECINVLGELGIGHVYAMCKRHVSQGWVRMSKIQSKDTMTPTSRIQQMRNSQLMRGRKRVLKTLQKRFMKGVTLNICRIQIVKCHLWTLLGKREHCYTLFLFSFLDSTLKSKKWVYQLGEKLKHTVGNESKISL